MLSMLRESTLSHCSHWACEDRSEHLEWKFVGDARSPLEKDMILAERSPGVHITQLLGPVNIDAQSGAIALEVGFVCSVWGPDDDGSSLVPSHPDNIFRLLGS